MTADYKLTYFDIKGYAEPIRILFALAKVPFDDVRLPYKIGQIEIPPQVKSKLPFGQVPILEFDDGQILSQSNTILRFLGRRFGFYGDDELESARVDEVMDGVKDYFELVRNVFLAKDEDAKSAALKTLLEVATPKYLKHFTSILEKNGGQFLVGKSWSVADIQVCRIPLVEDYFQLEILKNYPKIQEHIDRFGKIPQIADYLETRPKTVY